MDKKIILVSEDELRAIVRDTVDETIKRIDARSEEEYVFGLRGISRLFGVSKATALKYKKTFLAPAIEQEGARIRVNVKMAQRLFSRRKI